MIDRYGGCFEEGIWWVYGTYESCVVLERLQWWKDESAYNPWTQH